MAYHVYILQSQSTGRYYCGHTDDLARRIHQHNDPDYRGSRTTKVFQGPWELVWSQALEIRGEAMRAERRIKKRGIGRFLKDQSKMRPELSR
ncbi:MAG: GIY-YIG nuclease family protein [Desulfobacterales bacterium]|nr:GIY-YIG nuclease family protein [Desulfobacterales bacterium]